MALMSAFDVVNSGAFEPVGQGTITRTDDGGFQLRATFSSDVRMTGAHSSLDATLRINSWIAVETEPLGHLVYRDPGGDGTPAPLARFDMRQEPGSPQTLVDMVATLPPPGSTSP